MKKIGLLFSNVIKLFNDIYIYVYIYKSNTSKTDTCHTVVIIEG